MVSCGRGVRWAGALACALALCVLGLRRAIARAGAVDEDAGRDGRERVAAPARGRQRLRARASRPPPPVVDAGDSLRQRQRRRRTRAASDPSGPMTVDPNATSDDIYGADDRARRCVLGRARPHSSRPRRGAPARHQLVRPRDPVPGAVRPERRAARSVANLLAQLKSLGFNALRVPLAPESIKPGVPSMAWANRGAIDTGREHFEELTAAATERRDLHALGRAHVRGGGRPHEDRPSTTRVHGYGIDGLARGRAHAGARSPSSTRRTWSASTSSTNRTG